MTKIIFELNLGKKKIKVIKGVDYYSTEADYFLKVGRRVPAPYSLLERRKFPEEKLTQLAFFYDGDLPITIYAVESEYSDYVRLAMRVGTSNRYMFSPYTK